MNIIQKHPVNNLGYNFVDPKYIPKGKNEYHLRNKQNRNGISYRKLSALEIEVLVRNRNMLDDVVHSLPMFPTLSEAIKLTAMSFTKDISKLSCCV